MEMGEKLDAAFGRDAANYIRQLLNELERLRAQRDELMAALKANMPWHHLVTRQGGDADAR